MRFPYLATILALTVQLSSALAQDRAGVEETMKQIENLLNRQSAVKWVQAPKNAVGSDAVGVSVTAQVAAVVADPAACTVAFQLDRRFPDYRLSLTWTVPLKTVERITVDSLETSVERSRAEAGQEPWGTRTVPEVFELQINATAGQKFPVHRKSVNGAQEVIDKMQQQSPASLIFADAAMAQQVAGALKRAKELCRGVQ